MKAYLIQNQCNILMISKTIESNQFEEPPIFLLHPDGDILSVLEHLAFDRSCFIFTQLSHFIEQFKIYTLM